MKFFLIMGLFLLISNYSSAKESLNINNLESTQNNFFKQDSHNLNIEKTIVNIVHIVRTFPKNLNQHQIVRLVSLSKP